MPEWLKKIIEALKGKGIVTADNEADITKALEGIQLPADVDSNDTNEVIKALSIEVKSLREALGKEASEREAASKATSEREQKVFEAKIKAAVDKAILTDKKYPEAQREHLTKLFQADYDSTIKIVEAAPVPKEFSKGTQPVPAENKDGKPVSNREALKQAIATSMQAEGTAKV